jgi:eukaryotic-like serine/threonine-protein kinase
VGYAGLQPEDPREIGPYRLLGKLGHGGMGQVFLGRSMDGRSVAVKLIQSELAGDPDFRARFRLEVAAAQVVSNRFTAPVVDADLDAEVPWLATTYVSGPSLAEAVRDSGLLPISAVLALIAGLAEGLSAIHAAGVVHGNLKPSNVLLADDGPQVIDFGISRAAEASLGQGGLEKIASPGYVSPEQVVGTEIGPPSDIFSLGAVLTYAATGHGPFGTGSDTTLMDRVVNTPPDFGTMPATLRSLAEACLAKDPRDRPVAGDLLAHVGAIQSEPGWMAELAFAGYAAGEQPVSSVAPADSPVPFGAADAVLPAALASGQTASRRRWRRSRSLIPAYVTGGLVVVSAVAVLALTKPAVTPVAHAQGQPSAAATTPHPSASAKPRPSATHSALAAPIVYVPSVSPSALPVSAKPSAKASPTPSKSPTKSASPSPSPSKSATKSPPPSPSKSATTTASPTKSATTTAPPTTPASTTASSTKSPS